MACIYNIKSLLKGVKTMKNPKILWCSDYETYKKLTRDYYDKFIGIDTTQSIAEIDKILNDILYKYNQAEKLLLPDTSPIGLWAIENHYKEKSDVLTGLCRFEEAISCLNKAISIVQRPEYTFENKTETLKQYADSIVWLKEAQNNGESQAVSILPITQEKVSKFAPFIDKYGSLIITIFVIIVILSSIGIIR